MGLGLWAVGFVLWGLPCARVCHMIVRPPPSPVQVKCTTTGYVGAKAVTGYKGVKAQWTFKIASSSNSYISFGLSKPEGGTGDYREACVPSPFVCWRNGSSAVAPHACTPCTPSGLPSPLSPSLFSACACLSRLLR